MKTITVSSGLDFGLLDFIHLHGLGLLTCVILAVTCGWLISNHQQTKG